MAEVGCAGILVADTFCGPLDALPPAGSLVALDSLPSKAGGCAANVAIDLRKQGISVDVAGCLGRDPQANIVLGLLDEVGVNSQHVSYSATQPTSQTIVLLMRGQDRRYLHVFGANKDFAVSQIDRAWLKGLKVFYLGGLYAMPGIDMAELRDLLHFCQSNGIVTVVDVVVAEGDQDFQDLNEPLPYIDYFVPNEGEARHITGAVDPLDQIREFQSRGAKTVIITRGGAGCIAARGSEVWKAGVYPMSALDLSGSGDAFSAGLIVGILHGWDMKKTLGYASALGASATRSVGTTEGVFTAAEAESFVKSSPIEIAYEKMD